MTELELEMLKSIGATEAETKPKPMEERIDEQIAKMQHEITDEIGNKYRQGIRADGTVKLVMVESYTGELFE